MKMMFAKYHDGLSEFEGLPKRELVSPWGPTDIVSIEDNILPAWRESRIEFGVDANISNADRGAARGIAHIFEGCRNNGLIGEIYSFKDNPCIFNSRAETERHNSACMDANTGKRYGTAN